MGSGIAAQIANADLPVLLLDLPAKKAGQPHAAAAAIDRLLESDPPQLMHKKRAQLIATGTIDDDFDKLADCDLVIEAVIEQLPVKQAYINACIRRSHRIVLLPQTPQPFL